MRARMGRAGDADLESGARDADFRNRVWFARQDSFILTRLTKDDVLEELAGSREAIRRELGRSAAHVAYPNGDYDATVLWAAAEVGYVGGFTCVTGGNAKIDLRWKSDASTSAKTRPKV